VSTAEVSLIVAALAAAGSIGAVGVTYRLGVRRFDHEHKMEDRSDARTVLTEAALELGRMKSKMKDVLTTFSKPLETGEDWPDDYLDEISKLERATEALEAALAAVLVRFKQAEDVSTELQAAVDDVRSLMAVYFLAEKDGDRRRDRRERRNEEDDHSEALKFSTSFDAHRDAYLAAAQRMVGVQLDGD
jgi:hypothetical protein